MRITLLLLTLILFSGSIAKDDKSGLSQEEKERLVERHNFWRTDVGVTEKLEWSEEMSKLAADWARQLKKRNCGFEHRPDNNYGENLFKGTTGYYGPIEVVDAWGNEKEDYNYKKNKCKPGKVCGHYTQMVWETTKRVGCAKIECDGYEIWVCNYDPPGNWIGKKPY